MKKLFKLFALVPLFICGGALTLKNTSVQPLFAEGEEISEPAPAEESSEPIEASSEPIDVEEEPVAAEEETVSQRIVNFKDTFLVPLFSGVSITAIVSFIFSLSMAILNRKNNKHNAEENAKSREDVKKALELAASMAELAKQMVEQSEKGKEIEERTEAMFKENQKALISQVAKINENLEKVLAMKQCIILLINLEAELAKANPHVVSNGVYAKITTINEQAKKMF